jgi:hypothetical protein
VGAVEKHDIDIWHIALSHIVRAAAHSNSVPLIQTTFLLAAFPPHFILWKAVNFPFRCQALGF